MTKRKRDRETSNKALAWYFKLRREVPRAGGYTLHLILQTVLAAPLNFRERTLILVDLACFSSGDLKCPLCGDPGPHTSDMHHRFAKLTFTCRGCGGGFKATEV